MDIRERRNTEKIRLYLVPRDITPGQGFIMGPDKPVYHDHVLGVSPRGVLDIGGWGDFLTTLETLPDWAKDGDGSQHRENEDTDRIRLYLVKDYNRNETGYIPGWTPFAANDGSPRLLIAMPGAPAPKDPIGFLTTINELPDWAEKYDPQRSLDHARKMQRIARQRKKRPSP